jgi:hypothetical protein
MAHVRSPNLTHGGLPKLNALAAFSLRACFTIVVNFSRLPKKSAGSIGVSVTPNSFKQSPVCVFACLIWDFVHSLKHGKLVRPFVHSSIHPFVHSFVHLFVLFDVFVCDTVGLHTCKCEILQTCKCEILHVGESISTNPKINPNTKETGFTRRSKGWNSKAIASPQCHACYRSNGIRTHAGVLCADLFAARYRTVLFGANALLPNGLVWCKCAAASDNLARVLLWPERLQNANLFPSDLCLGPQQFFETNKQAAGTS